MHPAWFCLSVCQLQARVLSKGLDGSSYARTLCCKGIRVFSKITALACGTLFETLNLADFSEFLPRDVESSQVLST